MDGIGSATATSPGLWFATVPEASVREAAASQKPLGYRLLGERIVLWMTSGGAVVVQEDRCAHVDAELTTGVCGGDVLVCYYHGWTHDPDGTARPPGARNWKTPAKGWRRIRTYPSRAELGMVWVWTGPVDEIADLNLPTRRPPEIASISVPQPAATAAALLEGALGLAAGVLAAGGLAATGDDALVGAALTPRSETETDVSLFYSDGGQAQAQRLLDRLRAQSTAAPVGP